jgi:hypothetical protein
MANEPPRRRTPPPPREDVARSQEVALFRVDFVKGLQRQLAARDAALRACQEENRARHGSVSHFANRMLLAEAGKAVAESALPRTVEALRELVEKWREEGARIDTFHATMGTGYTACADALAAVIAGIPQDV